MKKRWDQGRKAGLAHPRGFYRDHAPAGLSRDELDRFQAGFLAGRFEAWVKGV